MAQKGIVKNSIGTEDIQATDFASIFNALIGGVSGVLTYGNSLKASIVNDNTIRLLDGVFSLKGFILYVEESTNIDLSIDSGTLGMNRMDAIVATYQKNIIGQESDVLIFEVIKGTPVAGTPVLPVLTTGDINASALKHQEAVFSVQIDGTKISKVTQIAKPIRSVKNMTDDLSYLMSMDVGGTIREK